MSQKSDSSSSPLAGPSRPAPRVLIVEDEASIQQGLVNLFVFHGFEVRAESDGGKGAEAALHDKFDLLILDVMLPTLDGFSICSQVRRAKPQLPIIMLTAKTSEDDLVHGLELGADDYIPKPFSVRVLLTRVQSLLRRTNQAAQQKFRIGDELEISPLDLQGHHIKSGKKIEFTVREIELLQYLRSEAARTKTRDELLHQVWGYKSGEDYETRTVDIHIAKLRKKIEPQPKSPRHLITVRGLGYRLIDETTPEATPGGRES
jgi:DNA-binding response OmpR family regulator